MDSDVDLDLRFNSILKKNDLDLDLSSLRFGFDLDL